MMPDSPEIIGIFYGFIILGLLHRKLHFLAIDNKKTLKNLHKKAVMVFKTMYSCNLTGETVYS